MRGREVAIAASVCGVCLLGGAFQPEGALAPPPALAYLLAAVSSVSMLIRLRAPVAAMVATTACGMLAAPLGLLPTPLLVAPALVSAHALGLRVGGRTAAAVLVPCAALLVVLSPFFEADISWEDASRLVTVAAAPLVAAVLGRSTRHRRAYLASVEERARRAEQDRDSEARRKVAEERVRIARELHDLVAHQMTLANAQAAVAARLLDTRPDRARASLAELVTTTRNALDELRSAVGLLRQPDDATDAAEPAPGLLQLPALLDSLSRAGLDVSIHQEGTPRSLPPAVDLTAYRTVQEALTNVTKHSTAAEAHLGFTWDRQRVTITIADGGLPRSVGGERRPGYGLIGMRERVEAVGGELDAGARPGGGFVVTAQLPLPHPGR